MESPAIQFPNVTIESYLAEQREISDTTRAKWRTMLTFIESQKLRKPLVQATREDINALVDLMLHGVWRTERGKELRLKNRTPATYLGTLSSFYNFVEEQSPGYRSPAYKIKMPRNRKEAERPVLNDDQLTKLMHSFEHDIPKHHPEARAGLFYHTLKIAGRHIMRAHEILPYSLDRPKTLCGCKGECTADPRHDFIIRQGEDGAWRIRFRVKGSGVTGARWSDWEPSDAEEVRLLKKIIADPPYVATAATVKLKVRGLEIGLHLKNRDGNEFPLGFHILAKHTTISRLVDNNVNPATINALAHWTPKSREWLRYGHPSDEAKENARKKARIKAFK